MKFIPFPFAACAMTIGILAGSMMGCEEEIATNPSGRFVNVYQKCFALQQNVFVIHYKNALGWDEEEVPYDLEPPAGTGAYGALISIEEYRSKVSESKAHSATPDGIEAVMLRGTRLRIDHLISLGNGDPDPRAMILDGPYKGKEVHVDELLTSPKWSVSTSGWEAMPAFLEPCSDEKK
jgi:hypothetical protein